MTVTTNDRVQAKAGRFYNIPELGLLPSVTTILTSIGKPALINWAAKVEREMVVEVSTELYLEPREKKLTSTQWQMQLTNRLGTTKASQKELTRAGDIGTEVHNLVEWTIRGQLMQKVGPSPKIRDAAQWAFMAWEDWQRSVKLKPIAVEQVVYSTKYGYAGTLDLLAEVNGVLTVIDWKTGKAVYSEAHLQNAAYRQAIREMGHGDPKQGIVVRLPKNIEDPEFEAVVADDEVKSFETFLHVQELWKWMQVKDKEYQAKKEPPLLDQLKKSLDAK
jgi:PD-(D/E)XK nuclease superfamily